MKTLGVLSLAVGLALAGCAGAGRGPAEREAAVARALAPSLVRVEYTLRFDRGEQPQTGQAALEEERPLEAAGFLVAPDEVVTADLGIHPRFVERVAVRLGDDVVAARPAAWARATEATLLRLERPLATGRPLVFDAGRPPPYFEVFHDETNGDWATHVKGFEPEIAVREDGRLARAVMAGTLVVDESGAPVGLVMSDEIAPDESWKGSPRDWPVCSADERATMLADLDARCDRAVVRATLHFRSPPRLEGSRRYSSREDEEGATEIHRTAVLLEGGRVLVLAALKPKVTARLERLVVHGAGGAALAATFVGSLADYGCLVAQLEKPVEGALAMSATDIREFRHRLLPAAEVRQRGENRAVFLDHSRIAGFNVGWRRQLYPRLGGPEAEPFLFDASGALVALPLARREKVSTENRWSTGESRLTPVGCLRTVLADLAKNTDPGNVPLAEAKERRLAWLGVILQPLNRDLARANGVADLTRDGETGALVSYVYADSPAAAAGIVPGMILLRLRVEGQPQPVEVRLEDYEDRGPFPWDRLEEVPETYYDRIPPPWESAENVFTRALTDLGFGRKFEADFFADGKVVAKPFEVTASPTHYDAAPRYKAAGLGLTVRDLTYEVRRYFRKTAEEPGVIVAKIDPGSKASVAGIKPYEIITHVNDKPVMNVKDFEQAVVADGEMRFSVKRMSQGRVVKLSAAGPAPAAAPDDADENAEPDGALNPRGARDPDARAGPDDGPPPDGDAEP